MNMLPKGTVPPNLTPWLTRIFCLYILAEVLVKYGYWDGVSFLGRIRFAVTHKLYALTAPLVGAIYYPLLQ